MSAPRVASTIDFSLPATAATFKSTSVPVERPVQITESQIGDKVVLCRQLNAMNLALAQTSHAQRSHPEQAPITFKNVVCGASGDKVILSHGFNSAVEYKVVLWRSRPLPAAATVAGDSLVCDLEEAPTTRKTTPHTLALNSYVAGMANIRVWPVR